MILKCFQPYWFWIIILCYCVQPKSENTYVYSTKVHLQNIIRRQRYNTYPEYRMNGPDKNLHGSMEYIILVRLGRKFNPASDH